MLPTSLPFARLRYIDTSVWDVVGKNEMQISITSDSHLVTNFCNDYMQRCMTTCLVFSTPKI